MINITKYSNNTHSSKQQKYRMAQKNWNMHAICKRLLNSEFIFIKCWLLATESIYACYYADIKYSLWHCDISQSGLTT